MTTDAEQPGEPAGRKFDDVASLFGNIVPAPGSALRPARPAQRLPADLPETPVPTVVPAPPATPEPVVERASAPAPLTVPAPVSMPPPRAVRPAAARPRPTEIPWPDAFEPRPNYRKPEPRNWSWLLLVPIGLMAAFGISFLDMRAIRGWIDVHVLHRTPIFATTDSPLLPKPFRSSVPGPAASTAAPALPAPDPELLNPTPAIPTSPVPVPPGVEVSPPPVDPAQAAAAAAAAPPIHVTIQYRRSIPGADGEARRLAALLQSTDGSVELHASATTVKSPTITFYNAADKQSASALALILANEATTWTVRQGTAKNPPGSLDIWMP